MKAATRAFAANEPGHPVNKQSYEGNQSVTNTTTILTRQSPRLPRFPPTGQPIDRTATNSPQERPARASSDTEYNSPYSRAGNNERTRQAIPASGQQQSQGGDAAPLEPRAPRRIGGNSGVGARSSQSAIRGTGAGALGSENPDASRALNHSQSMPSPSASRQDLSATERPATAEASSRNSSPNHRNVSHAEDLPEAGHGNNSGPSESSDTVDRGTAGVGSGVSASVAPQRPTVSSPQHPALPAQATTARHDNERDKSDKANGTGGLGSEVQSPLGSVENDLARQLGMKVLEYQRYQKLVPQAIQQRNEHLARVQEHEKRMSLEEVALHDMRKQLQLLQDKIKETQERFAKLGGVLQHERVLEQTARSQAENIEKQMTQLWTQLGF